MIPANQILQGDCVDVMRGFPENSIDCVVTDPPYGLNFMGKSWDKALPKKEAFTELNRVLKPGALAFVMSSPRQDVLWRMLRMLEESGFELQQSFISWVYASGFPKAFDVSKGIDKRNNRHLQYEEFGKYLEFKRLELGLSKKIIDDTLGTNTAYSWWEGRLSGVQLPSRKYYLQLKGILHLDNRYDELIERYEAEREKIGEAQAGFLAVNNVFELNNLDYGKYDLTKPSLNEAKKWSGWKSITGLKPALECILMVNKPLSEKTIVDNVLKWGTGAMNVDACRIPIDAPIEIGRGNREDQDTGIYGKINSQNIKTYQGAGRFPANLLVSDDALNDGKNYKTDTHFPKEVKAKSNFRSPQIQEEYRLKNEGSFSRYFNLDAWVKHHGFLNVPKAGTSERDFGLYLQDKGTPKSKFNLNDGSKEDRFDGGKVRKRRNLHPTVKPVELMAYLIELGCPPDGVVLDPFLGSGTTCIAAKKLHRKYIGIELDPEYYKLAVSRVAAFPEPLDWSLSRSTQT